MNEIILALLGSLGSLLVGILCFFLKGIYEEMKSMNSQLITVVSNMEWHYKEIIELKAENKAMTERLSVLEQWKSRVKDQLLEVR